MLRKQYKREAGVEDVHSIAVSFETDEQGAYRIYFPYPVTVNKIRSRVQKAIEATDDGTVTGANATGASTGGVITHGAADAIGQEEEATPTTNNDVDADSYYQLTTAKTTAGGKANVTLEVTRRG